MDVAGTRLSNVYSVISCEILYYRSHNLLALQLVDLDKALDVQITLKVRQNVAFKTECDPHEIEFVDGDAVDEDGFYFRY